MILESIVTSVDKTGAVNLAPMGPVIEDGERGADPAFVLRPFNSSRTYQNLIETRRAVIHVTDDAALIARAAVDAIDREDVMSLVHRLDDSNYWPLRDCHRWFAVEVDSVSERTPRVDMRCRVVRSEVVRPFFGFNRARHAVIEAAILATRTALIPGDEIRAELERLRPLIEKTGGPAEHDTFEFLQKTIDDRLAS